MSDIRNRVNRLERLASMTSECPACRDGQEAETVTVRYGDAAPPAKPCPRCGRERRQLAIVLFN